MSRRDELAAVLAQGRCGCGHDFGRHHIDMGCSAMDGNFSTCYCMNDMPGAEVDAVLGWLGEQLGDRDLSDAMVNGIRHAAGDIRQADESRNDRRGARALDVVREWFGSGSG